MLYEILFQDRINLNQAKQVQWNIFWKSAWFKWIFIEFAFNAKKAEQKFFGFKISHQGSVWPRSDSFFAHTPKNGLFKATMIHSIQKSTGNSQKLGKKLASRWYKIQGSKKREIELIS